MYWLKPLKLFEIPIETSKLHQKLISFEEKDRKSI